jgi:SAM-dependent methyltransferase
MTAIPAPAADALSKEQQYREQRRAYWQEYCREFSRWEPRRSSYRQRLAEIYRFFVPPGQRVLELGSGPGDLLAALRPSHGVGVDLAEGFVSLARQRHPQLRFECEDCHRLALGETFDYILLSDLPNDLWDIQRTLQRVREHAHAGTRVIVNFYSNLWQPVRALAVALGMAKFQPQQNWITREDLENLFRLEGFEVIRQSREVLCPVRIPLLAALLNRYLVKLWPFNHLALTNFLVARPLLRMPLEKEPKVTVVVAARNEEGNVPAIFARVPQMGAGTELIFVEGNSTDDTYGAIEREMARHPGKDVKLFKQPGKGKGDAVRTGFAAATGDLLMILDADLTVPPEDLPLFFRAWREGRGEFINGVRLVYPMEEKAMRFFNLIGNKFFAFAFSWLLSQNIKDTLCGTKVLSREHYRFIAENRSYFGDFDPFGDFDLIFGAAKYNLRIIDLPIRYRERTYGDTNIQRWRHGVILLRMVIYAMRRIKFV